MGGINPPKPEFPGSMEAVGAVPPEFAALVQDPPEVRAGEADHLALLCCAERLELHLDVYPDAGVGWSENRLPGTITKMVGTGVHPHFQIHPYF